MNRLIRMGVIGFMILGLKIYAQKAPIVLKKNELKSKVNNSSNTENDEKTLVNKIKLLNNKVEEYIKISQSNNAFGLEEAESKVNKYLKDTKNQLELVKSKGIATSEYEKEIFDLEMKFHQAKTSQDIKSNQVNSVKSEVDSLFNYLKKLRQYNVPNVLENGMYFYNEVRNIPLPIFSDMDNWLSKKEAQGVNIFSYKNEWGFFKKEFEECDKLLAGWLKEEQKYLNNFSQYNNDDLIVIQGYFESAFLVSDYFIGAFKSMTDLSTIKTNLDKNRKSIESKINAKLATIYVSDLHKISLNKAFFSNQKLELKTANKTNFKNVFKPSEGVIASVFLTDKVKVYCQNEGSFTLNMFSSIGIESEKDELGCFPYPIRVFKLEKGKTELAAFSFTLIPNDSNFDDINLFKYERMINYLIELGEGKHEILLKMCFNNGPVNWYGSVIREKIEIVIDKNEFEKLHVLKSKIINKIIEKTELPERGMINSLFETLGMEIAKSKGIIPTKCYLDGKDFTIYRNPQWPYRLSNRQIGGIFTYKDSDGNCWFQPFLIIEYYNSDGKYANPEAMILSEPVRILCNKI